MKTLHRLSPALLLCAGLLAGCGKSGETVAPAAGGPRASQDQADLSAAAARQPEFVDDGIYESPDRTDLALGSTAGGNALQDAIEPIAFWRAIGHVERRFEFAFADTDAAGHPTTGILTVHKLLSGSFNILVPDPNGTFEPHVVSKPLADHWVRRLLFKRVSTPDDARGLWRLAATSGIRVTSRDHTTEIVSLRVQSSAKDTTISDPLAFFRLRSLLLFDPDEEVTLTVTTQRADDIVLLVSRHQRRRLAANGDNTYTGTFKAPELLGVYHVGVNALSHATLYDDQAPYDSQSWILPFLVRGTQLAADTP